MSDDKKDDVEPIADVDLDDVQGGGRKLSQGNQVVKQIGNDTIVGIDKESEGFNIGMPPMTEKGFNIGMPPYAKKR